jgi:hypothetical protein
VKPNNTNVLGAIKPKESKQYLSEEFSPTTGNYLVFLDFVFSISSDMEHDHYVDAIVTIAYLLSITPRFRKK